MIQIPEQVRKIVQRLHDGGYEAWCVGGAVRDALLGREPGDWDVTTNALPETVLALFAPEALPTGLQHGTVTVGGGRGVEVTTYRRDGEYLDSRHPEHVEFTSSLEEDLARRDFTVNAIAMGLDGTLVDPFGGQADLTAGVLRAVGEPEKRFQEDALRVMRGLRFAARLGFSIEEDTADAMRRCAPLLRRIAVERIQVELTGLLCGEHVERVLLRYPDILGVFMPEILPSVGFAQHTKYHCYDVWEHTVHAVAQIPARPILRYTMLFHDLGKPDTFTLDAQGNGHFYGHWQSSAEKAEAIMERLRFDHRSREVILTLVDRHDMPLTLDERCVRRNLSRYGEEVVRQLLEVKRADNLAQAPAYRDRLVLVDQWRQLLDVVLASQDCFSLKQLAVKGGDITALGAVGPDVGRILQKLLELVIDELLPNERTALLDYAKEKLL